MADIGYGLTFGIYNGSTYVSVAEVVNITPPQLSRDAVETTDMESPDRYREYIPGLLDGGEASITISYTPSASDVIVTALTASTLGSFRITHANAVTVTFSAVVTGYAPGEHTPDGKMEATATFKVSGKPVWA
jgi:hypothetical protein